MSGLFFLWGRFLFSIDGIKDDGFFGDIVDGNNERIDIGVIIHGKQKEQYIKNDGDIGKNNQCLAGNRGNVKLFRCFSIQIGVQDKRNHNGKHKNRKKEPGR